MTQIYGFKNPTSCSDFDFGSAQYNGYTGGLSAEHILEFKLLARFLDDLNVKKGYDAYENPADSREDVTLCQYMKPYWSGPPASFITYDGSGVRNTPISWVSKAYPGTYSHADEFVLLDTGVNGVKERMWSTKAIYDPKAMAKAVKENPGAAVKRVRKVLGAWQYHTFGYVSDILVTQRDRVATTLGDLEDRLQGNTYTPPSGSISPYQRIGLKSEWQKWSKDIAASTIARTAAFLDMWTYELEKDYDSNSYRQEAKKDAKKQAVNDLVRALVKANNARNPWNNPFT